jgi:hypothetical protein
VDAKAFLGRGWSYPVQPTAPAANSAPPLAKDVVLVEHEEDIRQAVRIILETGRGERVMRPDFGAGLNEFLFEPINATTCALIQHRVMESLVTWEPRIRVETVDVAQNGNQPSRLDIEVEYSVRATNTFYNLVYPFYIAEADQ